MIRKSIVNLGVVTSSLTKAKQELENSKYVNMLLHKYVTSAQQKLIIEKMNEEPIFQAGLPVKQ